MVQRIVKEVLRLENTRCDEVSIHFVDEQMISDLHLSYFDDPSVTDCISFPMDFPGTEGYLVLGEVFVCPKVAINYSKRHPSTPFKETTLYIVHGLLHLLGYDDLEEEEEKVMREKEKLHMKNLNEGKLMLQHME